MTNRDSSLAVICSGAGDDAGAIHGSELEDGGRLEAITTTTRVANPSFVAVDPHQRTLYAVERMEGGTVSAFRFDADTGAVELLNRRSSEGAGPCYVSVDAAGEYVLTATYRGGTVAAFSIESDGRLGETTDVVRHAGSGADPDRQADPHPHSIRPGPRNRFVYVPDLGTDRIESYRLEDGRLLPTSAGGTTLHDGAGPRHLAFHPNGRLAYVVNELDSTVTVLERDTETGGIDPLETVGTLPGSFDGANEAADVHVHPSGRWLYATNRGHDSVACFAVEADGRRLRAIGHESTRGETPRTFAIAPGGDVVLVANQHGETVVGFAVDRETGLLTATSSLAVPKPVCVTILESH